jgi:hypothetical protein
VVNARTNNKRRKYQCRARTSQPAAKCLIVVTALIDLDCLVGDTTRRAGLRRRYDGSLTHCGKWCYCEKTDSDCVVEVVEMVRVMSCVSMMPAGSVTALYEKPLVASVTV